MVARAAKARDVAAGAVAVGALGAGVVVVAAAGVDVDVARRHLARPLEAVSGLLLCP